MNEEWVYFTHHRHLGYRKYRLLHLTHKLFAYLFSESAENVCFHLMQLLYSSFMPVYFHTANVTLCLNTSSCIK